MMIQINEGLCAERGGGLGDRVWVRGRGVQIKEGDKRERDRQTDREKQTDRQTDR